MCCRQFRDKTNSELPFYYWTPNERFSKLQTDFNTASSKLADYTICMQIGETMQQCLPLAEPYFLHATVQQSGRAFIRGPASRARAPPVVQYNSIARY